MRKLRQDFLQKAVELCSLAKQQGDFTTRRAYEEAAFIFMELADQVERQQREREAA